MPLNHRLSHVLLASGLAVACLAAGRGAHAQDIEITPAPAQSATAAPGVRLQGFPADAEITVRFIRTPPDGLPPAYSASATFRAGRDGAVSLASVPLRGDWTAPVPEAPFWSMQPDEGAPLPPPGVVQIHAQAKGVRKQA